MYTLKESENTVQNLACGSPEVKLHKAFPLVWSIYSVFCEWEVKQMLKIFKDNHTTMQAANTADRHQNSEWTSCKFSLPIESGSSFWALGTLITEILRDGARLSNFKFLQTNIPPSGVNLQLKYAFCKTEGLLERKQNAQTAVQLCICIETAVKAMLAWNAIIYYNMWSWFFQLTVFNFFQVFQWANSFSLCLLILFRYRNRLAAAGWFWTGRFI